jgi:hypothetical protein
LPGNALAGLLALAVIASGWERRPHNAAEWTAAGWPLLPAVSLEQLELLHSSSEPLASAEPASPGSSAATSRRTFATGINDSTTPSERRIWPGICTFADR